VDAAVTAFYVVGKNDPFPPTFPNQRRRCNPPTTAERTSFVPSSIPSGAALGEFTPPSLIILGVNEGIESGNGHPRPVDGSATPYRQTARRIRKCPQLRSMRLQRMHPRHRVGERAWRTPLLSKITAPPPPEAQPWCISFPLSPLVAREGDVGYGIQFRTVHSYALHHRRTGKAPRPFPFHAPRRPSRQLCDAVSGCIECLPSPKPTRGATTDPLTVPRPPTHLLMGRRWYLRRR